MFAIETSAIPSTGGEPNEQTHGEVVGSHCPRGIRGFSLVEVLVAMVLLSVVILGTTGLAVGVTYRIYGGRKMTETANLAQNVLEQVNRPEAYLYLDAASTASSAETVFERKNSAGVLVVTNPDTTGVYLAMRNRWRQLFLDTNLPYGTGEDNKSEIRVRVEAVPTAATFATATMLRIQVRVRWAERGVRPREVFLETMNLPKAE